VSGLASRADRLVARPPQVHRHHIDLGYALDEFEFSTKIYYPGIDLEALAGRFPSALLERVVCHIALFEGIKFCSPFPREFDVSALGRGLGQSSLRPFGSVYRNACAQHLYENAAPDYPGPVLRAPEAPERLEPFSREQTDGTMLVGSGGGKDSLVAMRLLEEAGVPFASFQWARSEYGRFARQHKLIDRLYAHTSPRERHCLSIYDDFTDGGFMELYHPRLRGVFTLGTPECIFEALPIALDRGYALMAVGNERSAERGNLFWPELGREVNHQWVKTLEAERLFARFIRENLLADFHYFSLLKPLHDHRIFRKLTAYPDALPDLHSCNVEKPWCKKCPKCAYVWLNYMAHFEPELIDRLFGSNLFDDPELLPFFRQLMGLEAHNAFECVGHIEETRLALRRCLQKGLKGEALEVFQRELLGGPLRTVDWAALEARYDRVHLDDHAIPEPVLGRVRPLL
jgi:hypothetical protein